MRLLGTQAYCEVTLHVLSFCLEASKYSYDNDYHIDVKACTSSGGSEFIRLKWIPSGMAVSFAPSSRTSPICFNSFDNPYLRVIC